MGQDTQWLLRAWRYSRSKSGFPSHAYSVTQVVPDSVTAWTVARQAPLSMGFSRQEYWSGLPFPPPGHLPYAGIKPTSPALACRFFTTESPGKPFEFPLTGSNISTCITGTT